MIRILLSVVACFLVFQPAWARAGGGESSGLYVGGAAALIGTPLAALVIAIYVIRRKKLMAAAAQNLALAQKSDPSWDLGELKKRAKKIFMAYQIAWSKQNLAPVRDLMHVDYYEKASRQLREQIERGEVNVIKSAKVLEMQLMSVRDLESKDGDMFVMEMTGSLIDYTLKLSDRSFVSSPLEQGSEESLNDYIQRAQTEPDTFNEFWVFIRHNQQWKLWQIHQSTSIIEDLKNLSVSQLEDILKRENASKAADEATFYR